MVTSQKFDLSNAQDNRKLKFALLILDGYGLRDNPENNAVLQAKTPYFDKLYVTNPMSELLASGRAVGLPEGVMGNSEVGHMTIGSGRINRHELVRINDAISDGSLGTNSNLIAAFDQTMKNNSRLHLLGLLSDGGVHSHIDHLKSLLLLAREAGVEQVMLHLITDGRDTPPKSGKDYVGDIKHFMDETSSGKIATVMGRYYAMDRDKRWERTGIAYDCYSKAIGERYDDPVRAVEASYSYGVTDEFIKPVLISDDAHSSPVVREGDSLLFFNFRADRMRQIVTAFGSGSFDEFNRTLPPLNCTTMTSYNDSFDYPILFERGELTNTLTSVLSKAGYTQLRLAETEKYAHVTYFFNGGEEQPFPGEERILVPSPKVATYDLQPEMSAPEVRDTALKAVQSDDYDCLILNFANPDMVGHTGDMEAAIRAMEVVDEAVKTISTAVTEKGGTVFITADHGNLEMMVDEISGETHTAHTLNPVPFFVVNQESKVKLQKRGGLADIAPTILDLLDMTIPEEMTGQSLVIHDEN